MPPSCDSFETFPTDERSSSRAAQKAARILVGSIGHESNTFAPYTTGLEDFTPRFGARSLEPPFHQEAYAGILETLRDADRSLVPTVDAHALPGGGSTGRRSRG